MNYVLKLCLLVTLILSSAAFAVAQEASPKPATEPQTEAKAQEAQPEAATKNVAPQPKRNPLSLLHRQDRNPRSIFIALSNSPAPVSNLLCIATRKSWHGWIMAATSVSL